MDIKHSQISCGIRYFYTHCEVALPLWPSTIIFDCILWHIETISAWQLQYWPFICVFYFCKLQFPDPDRPVIRLSSMNYTWLLSAWLFSNLPRIPFSCFTILIQEGNVWWGLLQEFYKTPVRWSACVWTPLNTPIPEDITLYNLNSVNAFDKICVSPCYFQWIYDFAQHQHTYRLYS